MPMGSRIRCMMARLHRCRSFLELSFSDICGSELLSDLLLLHESHAGKTSNFRANRTPHFVRKFKILRGPVCHAPYVVFIDAEGVNITAKNIVVWGEMQVGNLTHPYGNRTAITLTGVRTDPTPIVDSDLFLGNKVCLFVYSHRSAKQCP